MPSLSRSLYFKRDELPEVSISVVPSELIFSRVYDLTIENDESFTVGLAAVHNCHRASQTSDKVQIIRMICQDTIDEDIEKLLNDKETITSQVLDGEIITKDVKLSIFKDIVNLIVRKKNF